MRSVTFARFKAKSRPTGRCRRCTRRKTLSSLCPCPQPSLVHPLSRHAILQMDPSLVIRERPRIPSCPSALGTRRFWPREVLSTPWTYFTSHRPSKPVLPTTVRFATSFAVSAPRVTTLVLTVMMELRRTATASSTRSPSVPSTPSISTT